MIRLLGRSAALIAIVAIGLLVTRYSLLAEEPVANEAEETETHASGDQAILEDIARGRAEVERARAELAAREAELVAREKALEDEIAKLKEMRKEISAIEAGKRAENEAKVARLVETLELMSPKSGSKLLAGVEQDLAVEVMARLSTERLSKLMAQMDVANATRLSERYTGYLSKTRSASAPVVMAPPQAKETGNRAPAREGGANGAKSAR